MNPYSTLTERQAAILRSVQDAHASGPASAVSKHSLHLQGDADLDVLISLRIIQPDPSNPDWVYASLSRGVFSPEGSQRKTAIILGTLTVVVLIVTIALFVLGPPRPQ
jgi:hypothetical protein